MNASNLAALYRRLPSVDALLDAPPLIDWSTRRQVGRDFLRGAVNAYLDRLRAAIAEGETPAALAHQAHCTDLADLASHAAGVIDVAERLLAPHLQRVINATGIVVHTNLGRSPWCAAAAERVSSLARGYLNLELDLESGRRGDRDVVLSRPLEQLLPGSAAVAVNNNAAAVLLVLNTLAEGREVIVSRGQLVEIGGSFRIPDVMAKGGCRLREVGTTNRTRVDDFRAAIGPETGMLLAVHPSNYRLVGFTEEADVAELVALGAEHDIPVVEDLGSGSLVDLADFGIDEPTVGSRLAEGLDLVTFSGDKLLGGPQAGFVAGKRHLVAQVRRNPLFRAMRLDRASLLALEATLLEYVAGRYEGIPAVAMLMATADQVHERACALAKRIGTACPDLGAEVVATQSQAGGGAAPEVGLPSFGVALSGDLSADSLAARLRAQQPAVLTRIVDDRVVIEVRTLLPGEANEVAAACSQV